MDSYTLQKVHTFPVLNVSCGTLSQVHVLSGMPDSLFISIFMFTLWNLMRVFFL